MSRQHALFQIVDRQQGYFTAGQAQEAGFHRSHFHRKLESGEWVKEGRGIYRLVDYPIGDRAELVLWTLWSRNREGSPEGVWSHETALDIHNLSDVMPDKMHMTVPTTFRRRSDIPKVLRLHWSDLSGSDVEARQGFGVTTPLRTIIDVVRDGRMHDGLLSQAVHQARDRGLLLKQDIAALKCVDPIVYLKVQELLDDKRI